MRPKSRARMDFLDGLEWESELYGCSVLCTGDELQELDSGNVLKVINNDDDIQDIWDDYKMSLIDPFEGRG